MLSVKNLTEVGSENPVCSCESQINLNQQHQLVRCPLIIPAQTRVSSKDVHLFGKMRWWLKPAGLYYLEGWPSEPLGLESVSQMQSLHLGREWVTRSWYWTDVVVLKSSVWNNEVVQCPNIITAGLLVFTSFCDEACKFPTDWTSMHFPPSNKKNKTTGV